MRISHTRVATPNSAANSLPTPFWPTKFRCRQPRLYQFKKLISLIFLAHRRVLWTREQVFSLPSGRGCSVEGRLKARFRSGPGGCQIGGIADYDKAQLFGIEEVSGDPARLVMGHRGEQRRAVIEIIDREPLQLHFDQQRRDLLARIEAQRERPDQVALGLVELGLGRAFLAHPPPFAANEVDRLCDPRILGGDVAEDQRGMAKCDEPGRDAVSEPALLADLLDQAAAKAAAANDIVEETRGVPVGIVAFEAALAKSDGALRHCEPADQQVAALRRAGLGHIDGAGAERQTTEYPA